MEVLIAYIIFSIVAGVLGAKRKIGFAGAFFLSLAISPLIGFIAVLCSKRKSDIEYERKMLANMAQAQKNEFKEVPQSQYTAEDMKGF
jgi:hypothetical protein